MPWSNQAVELIMLTEAAGGYSGMFGYSPVPGPGNLIFSLAAAAGTDPYGNAYPAGLTVGSPGNFQVQMTEDTGNGLLIFPVPVTGYDNAFIKSQAISGVPYFAVTGPISQASGLGDTTQLQFSANSGTVDAVMDFIYYDDSGAGHTFAAMNTGGFQIGAGSITAVQPGTGQSPTNPSARPGISSAR